MLIRRRPLGALPHLDGIPAKLAQIYASRGITQQHELDTSAKALLHFQSMNGIQVAVELLAEAIQQGKKIILVGDFDADGATSVALCMLGLGAMGSRQHDFLVPNRFDFGYGLSPQIVDIAAQQGAELIITVDNGISSISGVARAKQLGMQVIVTDHHLPGEQLPVADAIVNPNQRGCDFVSKNLAGVGVAFYLLLALRQQLQQENWFAEQNLSIPNLASWLDIVALGTVADVVPLDANNRILVHQGIQRIRAGKCRPGILALLEVAGRDHKRLTASDLGFILGPRLNAAGRLDDMTLGIQCLITEDIAMARRCAVQLDSLNRQRRDIEQGMQQDAEQALAALQMDEQSLPNGLVLHQADWHQGVIGIVAGRIKERYFRPTIAFAEQDEQTLKGSARSIPGLHIRDALEEVSKRHPGLIDKFGGHAMAAGLSLPKMHLAAFQQGFVDVCSEWLDAQALTGEIWSDGGLHAEDLTLEFAQQLKDAGPWGQQFEEPLFDDEFVLREQRIVGDRHLKMQVEHPSGMLLDAIAFNVDLEQWPDRTQATARLAYRLDINEFRGRVSLQLLVQALQKGVDRGTDIA